MEFLPKLSVLAVGDNRLVFALQHVLSTSTNDSCVLSILSVQMVEIEKVSILNNYDIVEGAVHGK